MIMMENKDVSTLWAKGRRVAYVDVYIDAIMKLKPMGLDDRAIEILREYLVEKVKEMDVKIEKYGEKENGN